MWRPKAAAFVCALNGASILALSTIYDLRLSKTGRIVVGRTFDWMVGRSDAVSLLSGSIFKDTIVPKKQMASPHRSCFGHSFFRNMCLNKSDYLDYTDGGNTGPGWPV